MSKPEEYSPTDFNPELKNYELGIEYGQQLAEERIIKLLEDAGFMEYAIRLIKGEQK